MKAREYAMLQWLNTSDSPPTGLTAIGWLPAAMYSLYSGDGIALINHIDQGAFANGGALGHSLESMGVPYNGGGSGPPRINLATHSASADEFKTTGVAEPPGPYLQLRSNHVNTGADTASANAWWALQYVTDYPEWPCDETYMGRFVATNAAFPKDADGEDVTTPGGANGMQNFTEIGHCILRPIYFDKQAHRYDVLPTLGYEPLEVNVARPVAGQIVCRPVPAPATTYIELDNSMTIYPLLGQMARSLTDEIIQALDPGASSPAGTSFAWRSGGAGVLIPGGSGPEALASTEFLVSAFPSLRDLGIGDYPLFRSPVFPMTGTRAMLIAGMMLRDSASDLEVDVYLRTWGQR